MPRLLLSDIGHVENFGDRMVSEVVSVGLGSRVPDLEIARLTAIGSEAPIPGYWQHARDDWVALANECDLVLMLGGSIFFPDRIRAVDLERLPQLRVPLVIWGGVQDHRWLATPKAQDTLGRLLCRSTKAFYRFPGEIEVLEDLASGTELVLGGDPGFLFPVGTPKKRDRLVLALSRYLLDRFPASEQVLPEVCTALGQRYELIAVWCETGDAERFQKLLPGVNNIFGYAHVLTTLRNCARVVGCRLHPLVLGASQRVPTVGWEIGSRKIRWFMEAMGAEAALIDLSGDASPSDIEHSVALIDSWPVDAGDYASRAAELGAATRGTLDWIADALR